MANWLARFNPFKVKADEGAWRPGPYSLPISGGWLPDGAPLNWWQTGMNVQGYQGSAMVEACISAYSQTVAMCPGDHWTDDGKGGRKRIDNSALSRILREPNSYQTISDFLLNAVRHLYSQGNAYALAIRNNRFEISELHLMNPYSCSAMVAENGEIFYSLSGNRVIESRLGYDATKLMVPARDVLHIKLHTSNDILRGETPLVAALQDIATNDAMMRQQLAFFLNQARPSIVLQTDLVLDRDKVEQLRTQWNEQARGLNAGGTPILTAGLKAQTLGNVPATDAQVAELMKINEQHVALAFRVPLPILGFGGSSTGSTEALMQGWIASGLGFCLNHVEEAFDKIFDLWGQPDEYVEFDTSVLLRSDQKTRIEALARGVQGGIYSPNEAREQEGLPDVAFGQEPRVQQQVVPLSAAAGIPSAPSAPGPGPTPAPALEPPAPKAVNRDVAIKRISGQWLGAAEGYDRRRISSV